MPPPDPWHHTAIMGVLLSVLTARLRALPLVLSLACAVALIAATLSAPGASLDVSFAGAAVDPTTSPKGPPVGRYDFPKLPAHCYDAGQDTPRPGPCHVNSFKRSRPSVLLWGDSHAWMYLPALRNAVRGKHVNLVALLSGGCPPTIPKAQVPGNYYTKCEHHNVLSLKYVKDLRARHADFKLVLGSFWGGYRRGYNRLRRDEDAPVSGFNEFTTHMIQLAHYGTKPLFAKLGRLKVDVDVIAEAATVPPNTLPCPSGQEPYQCELPRFRAIPEEQSTRHWLKGLMKSLAGRPRYIDATSVYCDPTTCFHKVHGINTYYDHLHIGAALTATMTRFFAPSVADVR